MNEKTAFLYLKTVGCCNGCCLRYLGVKNHQAYEKIDEYITKYSQDDPKEITSHTQAPPPTDIAENPAGNTENDEKLNTETTGITKNTTNMTENTTSETSTILKSDGISSNGTTRDSSASVNNGKDSSPPMTCVDDSESPPVKRRKWAVCVSCIGVLQTETWAECIEKAKEVIEKKRYECETFACALSAPISTFLREKAITLLLKDKFPEYKDSVITPLKEAWKFSFAAQLATNINKTLDSGSFSPLLITFNLEYADDLEELEPLKKLSPALFESRKRQQSRFTVEMTRRSVQEALEKLTLSDMKSVWPNVVPDCNRSIECVSVVAAHDPVYFGGRYIKLSRQLCQTPWVLNGVRMMETSVQEIIFGPIAKLYGISKEASEHRMKFLSAGREDVDVRCLGNGRPFAIEVSDPRREPTENELADICKEISLDGRVVVKKLQIVSKNDLSLLKQGEETKRKTYNALCIKLSHSEHDLKNGIKPGDPITVTETDIKNINFHTNTTEDEARISIVQKTPIRVLHRRPLLERKRKIFELTASLVPGHPQLFTINIVTEAGTYIKEYCCGELRRSRPSLCDAMAAAVDILALDVAAVHLDWPEKTEKST